MLRRHWQAALLFFALTLTLTNPLALHLWNAVEDKQDALLNTWIVAWVGQVAITDPLNLYNTNIFYPYQNTLAFSEILVPQGLLALPITLATNNPIFGYNLVLCAMFWLNAFAMYLLVFDWTRSRSAGLVAGAIYAFNPFSLGNLAQIQLISLGWLPLALLFLQRVLRVREKNTRAPHAPILFALFFILQSLSSIYYALLTGFAIAIYFIWWLWAQRSIIRTRLFVSSVGRLFFSILLSALILIPFLWPYFSVQRELGFQRRVEESEPFSASLQQFIQVSPQNMLYGRWLPPNPVRYIGGYPLDNLFPGFVALMLASIGLLRSARARGFLLVLLIVAFVFSLGPRLYLTSQQATNIILPYRWLFEFFPPMRALRAPVRFEALIMFALAALAGLGMRALGQKRAMVFTLGAVIFIAVEYLAWPAAQTIVLPVASEVPPVYQWLAKQPPGVVLELPMMGPDAQNRLDISKQYFTTFHWHATPDGYSGFIPPRRGEIAYEMQSFPSARTLSLLRALDVRYVVIHFDQVTFQRDEIACASGLSLVWESGETRVYRVAPLLSTVQLDMRLYVPQPVPIGVPFTAYLILSNSSHQPFAVKPTEKINLTAHWNIQYEEKISTTIPLVTYQTSVVPITLRAPTIANQFSLTLNADGGAVGAFALQEDVVVSSHSSSEIVIPAQVKLTNLLDAEYVRGATIPVRVTWNALNKIDAYYSVSMRVVNVRGEKIVAIDREPRGQTFLWKPDELIADQFDLRLPGDLASGDYRVELVMYNANSDASVLLLDENFNPREKFMLGGFRVK